MMNGRVFWQESLQEETLLQAALLGMHNERKDHRKDHQQFQITTLGATALKSALYQPFLFNGHL